MNKNTDIINENIDKDITLNKKASKSGNTAKASATGVRYTNGHAVQSITRTVTLTCSATGNFS